MHLLIDEIGQLGIITVYDRLLVLIVVVDLHFVGFVVVYFRELLLLRALLSLPICAIGVIAAAIFFKDFLIDPRANSPSPT